jgi:hypothetical protein
MTHIFDLKNKIISTSSNSNKINNKLNRSDFLPKI